MANTIAQIASMMTLRIVAHAPSADCAPRIAPTINSALDLPNSNVS